MDTQIEPYALDEFIVSEKKNEKKMWRKVQFEVSICLKLVPQILYPGLTSKVALRTEIVQLDRWELQGGGRGDCLCAGHTFKTYILSFLLMD